MLEDAVVRRSCPLTMRAVAAREIGCEGVPRLAGSESIRDVLPAHGLIGDADRARRVAPDDHLAREERVRRGELLEARRVEQHEPRPRRLRRREDGGASSFVRRRDAGAEPIHHGRGA